MKRDERLELHLPAPAIALSTFHLEPAGVFKKSLAMVKGFTLLDKSQPFCHTLCDISKVEQTTDKHEKL